MKRYIAFHNSSNSGIQTMKKALEWATNLLGETKVSKVYIAEVVETVERTAPIVKVQPFLAQHEDAELVNKVA